MLPHKLLNEHTDCYTSDTPHTTLQHVLVFLYLILPSCPTQSVSPVREQITFMPVRHSYRSRVIAYQEIYNIICKPCPFSPFPKLYWLFRKKKNRSMHCTKFLTICSGSSNTDSNHLLWFPAHCGKSISISYALMLLFLQVSKWQVNSANNPSVTKEAPGLTDRQF